jgi:hypothetical protein
MKTANPVMNAENERIKKQEIGNIGAAIFLWIIGAFLVIVSLILPYVSIKISGVAVGMIMISIGFLCLDFKTPKAYKIATGTSYGILGLLVLMLVLLIIGLMKGIIHLS